MTEPTIRALGLMSGTSMDGIDAAILESDGHAIRALGPTVYQPYEDADRTLIRQAMDAARGLTDRDARPGVLGAAEDCITRRHSAVIARLLERSGPVDLVGFHGQTVFHAPDRGLTVQIGDAKALSDACRLPVVHDMRADDVARGGQGAPLAPVFHQAVAYHLGLDLPAAIVNIGGVANATWIGADGDLAACDTGPGNALMNDWVNRQTGADFDKDGALAAKGRVDDAALATLLDNPYFDLDWPKSLDRDAFSLDPVSHLNLADGTATLAAFTVKTLAASLRRFERLPATVLISGGGARNPVLLQKLAEELGIPVLTMDQAGLSANFIEAQAFAYCAIRSTKGLALTFPGTTGIPVAASGGRLASPT